MKIIDKMNFINDKYIEETLEIDNKQKLKKVKERKKINIWKYIAMPITCICILALGIVYVHNYNLKQEETKIVKTNNKYLEANYSMLLYKESTDYIREKINLEAMNNEQTITIKSEELLENSDGKEENEYKYCSGKVIIKKVKNDIYEHTIESNCQNEASNNVDLTMKIYTNINQNSTYQIITDIKETTEGYVGTLTNYDIEKRDNYFSKSYNSISGTITIDKDLNIKDINLFDKEKMGLNTNLIYLDNNYLLTEYSSENNGIINFYDKDFNLIWKKTITNNDMGYLYETDNELVFIKSYNSKKEIVKLDKQNGNIKETKTIKNINLDYMEYHDGYLLKFDYIDTYKIYKYDLEGNLIYTINLLDIDGIEHTNSFIGSKLGNNFSIYKNKNLLYVFDKDGNLINKIKTELDNRYTIESYYVSSEYYEVIYNNNSQTYSYDEFGNKKLTKGNQKKYIKYDSNNNIVISVDIDETYGYNKLQEIGLILNDTSNYSKIIDSKLFEYIYSPDNNGTLIMMLYDYSKNKE